MKLPPQKKILREDLKEAPAWIGGVIEPVNSFMEAVYQSLNHNVTLQDNVASFVKELTYKTPSTYPASVEVVTFENELRTKAIGVVLLQAYDKSNYTPAPGPVYVPWVENSGSISIHTLTGLAANKTYVIRFVIF